MYASQLSKDEPRDSDKDTLVEPAPKTGEVASEAAAGDVPAAKPKSNERYASGLPRAALKILAPTLPPASADAPVDVHDAAQTDAASEASADDQPEIEEEKSSPRSFGEVHVFLRRNVEDDINDMVKAENEINGSVIRRVREARGVTIEELSEQTKVSKSVLRAIEAHEFDALPARVYLRGFLTQVARVLRVDKKRVADGYLSFVERHGRA